MRGGKTLVGTEYNTLVCVCVCVNMNVCIKGSVYKCEHENVCV